MPASRSLGEKPLVVVLLRAHAVLGRLPEASIVRLASTATVVRYAARAALFRAGARADALFAIVEGRVRISVTQDGRTRVLHWEEAGGLLGEVPCFDGGAYVATATAKTTEVAIRLPTDAVVRDIAVESPLGGVLLTRMAARARMLASRLEEATSQPIAARLDGYLRERARLSDGSHFSLGMTQQALAEELGTVREVLVRELARLRNQGVLEVRAGGRYRMAPRKEASGQVPRE